MMLAPTQVKHTHFIPRAGYLQWGNFKPLLGFHRPLRDYIAACKRAGLELRDLEEPFLTEEAQRELPAPEVQEARRVAVSYVLKTVKAANHGDTEARR